MVVNEILRMSCVCDCRKVSTNAKKNFCIFVCKRQFFVFIFFTFFDFSLPFKLCASHWNKFAPVWVCKYLVGRFSLCSFGRDDVRGKRWCGRLIISPPPNVQHSLTHSPNHLHLSFEKCSIVDVIYSKTNEKKAEPMYITIQIGNNKCIQIVGPAALMAFME